MTYHKPESLSAVVEDPTLRANPYFFSVVYRFIVNTEQNPHASNGTMLSYMAAIYQQARPFTFDQVLGQNHIKDVLVAALQRGRIGHAYLFSGPRGVGKTTTARLLAMAVNCEHKDPAKRPCGACESCQLVRSGNHPDVTELDAASNNSVEDIRDLREKVRLSSMRGGKRVWVLDEAHMLSRAASNALLKTLEEPPDNLVFILATTEPEKLPPTILSRCQHFRFRRLSEEEISSKLGRLCKEANVNAEPSALSLVARAADGAMRDAESLLERLLTSGEAITQHMAEEALGLPPQERMQELARYLSEQRLNDVFSLAAELYQAGFAPSSLAEALLKTLREALIAKVQNINTFKLESSENDLLRTIHALDDELERFSKRDNLFALEVALIKANNALTNNLPQAVISEAQTVQSQTIQPPAHQGTKPDLPDFDPFAKPKKQPSAVASPDFIPSSQPLASPPPSALQQPTEVAREEKISTSPPTSSVSELPLPTRNKPQKTFNPSNELPFSWHEVLTRADLKLKAFLRPARAELLENEIVVRYEPNYKFHFSQLKINQAHFEDLIYQLYGTAYSIVIQGEGETIRKKW
ncbi:MAG: DNA polymerase III subunit gamma/tau [Trueperaceae bacterium]